MSRLKTIPTGTDVIVRMPLTLEERGVINSPPFVDPDDGTVWYPIWYQGMVVNTRARFIVCALGVSTWTTQLLP